MKISIGTKSELKIRAVKDALKKLSIEADVVFDETESGVSFQPFGFEETIKGAKQRAKQSFVKHNSDFSIGIENGIVFLDAIKEYYDTACVFIISKEGEESFGFSSMIFVPDNVIKRIKEGEEFGPITQRVSGDKEKDHVKYFSNGKIKREELISQAVSCAFLKIINKDKYNKI